ncbi:peptidase [Veronia nyctiphanis]|uniref:Peptidase n=1 Tax=Veronia nyctiphanis TaxID=1278244 RepID=A0A4Q0YV41_9GAMM|nr:peptidase [Veronia nyctiphanis]
MVLFLHTFSVSAVEYQLPSHGSRIIGKNLTHITEKSEDLESIAAKYNVGFLALIAANPGISPHLVEPGTFIKIPQQLILPVVDYEGIVVNLAELRLYYFEKGKNNVHVFPIGIGRVGRETPLMTTRIRTKRENPTWRPTKEIRKEYLEREIELPAVVPPGPDNPLGTHALRLDYGAGEYLIHGTNKDFGIGLRVSSGCIRMRPTDIVWLFDKSRVGETVKIINQAVKISVEPDGAVFVEAHRPLSRTKEERDKRLVSRPDDLLTEWLGDDSLHAKRYRATLAVQSGIPVEVGTMPL